MIASTMELLAAARRERDKLATDLATARFQISGLGERVAYQDILIAQLSAELDEAHLVGAALAADLTATNEGNAVFVAALAETIEDMEIETARQLGHAATRTVVIQTTTPPVEPLAARYQLFSRLREELSEAGVCLACGTSSPGWSFCQCENDE